MSLLDDVSIVVTPNGYKAGTLYGVLPTATEGAELVVNGDFSSGTSPWALNPNWSLGGVGVIADGTSNSTIWQSGVVEDNKQYIVTYTLTDFLQGSINVDLSGGNGITRTVAGTYTEVITSGTSPTTRLSFEGGLSFKVTLSNISVKEWTASDMDVTRETAATRVDENGLVNYAEVLGSELVVNGDFDTNINSWEQYNSVSTWDNGTIKTTSNTTVAWIRQNDILSTGNFYKIIFKAKASNISQNIHIWNGASFIDTGLSFDSINTYKEFTYYLDFTGAGGQHLILGQQVIGNGDTINFDNVSAKEVDRNNVPRIDYTGGGCPHILAEPQRTNLITYSEDFTQSAWTKTNVDVSNNTELAPSGTLTATRTIISSTGTDLRTQCNVIASSNYTFSFYAKKGTSTDITYRVYDVSNGSNIVSPTNYYSQLSTDWERVSLNFTTPSGCTSVFVYLTSDSVEIGDIYLWGAQLELGSYPTSYIPTSGSSVTRNKDVFSRDGIGSLINDSEGVLFVEAKTTYDSSTSRRISLSDGSINNRVMLEFDETTENTIKAVITTGGVNSAIMTFAASDLSQYNKIAIKYKLNDFSIWFNGTEVVTDSSGGVPTGLTQLVLDGGDGSNFFYGEVKQLQVYNTALTDMQLIQLTGTSGTDFYESYSEMAESLTYTIQ